MILDSFRQDVRVGLRVLFKEKAFCFLAVLVLGLGIGGATTQFTVVNAIMLRGFSFPHPEQLVGVGLIDPKATDQVNNFGAGNIPTAQDYEDIKAAQKSFTMMAGYLSASTINLTYKNTPQRYTGGYVTEDMFKIVGVSPAMGRDFTAEDNKPGSEKTIILGDEIWRRDFNADPSVIGQSVRVNSKAATIIGVMPPGFKFPFSEELWTPLYNEFPPTPRGGLFLGANNRAPAVLGRLKPGVTLDQANAELIGIARHLAEDNPKTNQNFTSASVQPLLNAFTGVQLRQIVWAMLAAVIFVLLIACVNVMNMQFGRAALRAKELAIRGALGATRWRLVRPLLTGCFVVAVFGTVAGVLIAYWGVDLLARAIKAAPFPPPYWWQFTIDGRVLTFTLVITLVATVVSGLVPAFLSSRGSAAEILKEGGRGNTSRLVNLITRVLVVGQIALTAALLIAATLQIKSIRNQTKLDYGYDENGVYAARMALMEGAYPTEDARRDFFMRAVRALRANSQFDSAAVTDRFRMTFAPNGQYEVDGKNYLTERDRPRAGQRAETLGPALSRAVADLDSNLPTYFPGTPAAFHKEVLSGSRLIARLFTIFGIVAFILSAVGLYGVMSFSVNQRTQEFGIRMALGADAKRIFRMVMTQGAWQLASGLVLGAGGIALLLGVVAAAALKNILFKVNALDPTIYFAVSALLTAVAAASCFVPARRATRVDPMVALRYE